MLILEKAAPSRQEIGSLGSAQHFSGRIKRQATTSGGMKDNKHNET